MPESAETKAQLKAIADDIALIKKLLTGNGDPSKGIIVRLDRLEGSDNRRNWLVRSAVGASFLALADFIFRLFKGG